MEPRRCSFFCGAGQGRGGRGLAFGVLEMACSSPKEDLSLLVLSMTSKHLHTGCHVLINYSVFTPTVYIR